MMRTVNIVIFTAIDIHILMSIVQIHASHVDIFLNDVRVTVPLSIEGL